MNPKDLLPPENWTGNEPLCEEGVFYLPRRQEFCAEVLTWPRIEELFSHPFQTLSVEFCSGNGHWIVEQARMQPKGGFVAVERRFDRVRKIWSKAQNAGIENLLIICGEALLATSYLFPSASIDHLFINFPDPWPKRRHAKNRLISSMLFDQVSPSLCTGGKITLVTDDLATSDRWVSFVEAHPHYRFSWGERSYVTHLPEYGTSWFETLWRCHGREIRYHQAERIACTS